MSTANRAPDLTILCSRRADTVTARVYAGVLVWDAGRASVDLRGLGAAMTVRRDMSCRCGHEHGDGWAVQVVRERQGKVTTADLDRLSSEYLSRD